jgi:hypothetical protein
MKGQVIGLNQDRCAVLTPAGITVFRIISEHSTQAGDVISGNLDALGPEPLVNETRGERIKAFLTAWGCSQKKADRYLNP